MITIDTRPTEPDGFELPDECPVCERPNADADGEPIFTDPAYCSEHCARKDTDGAYAVVNVDADSYYVGDETDGCYVGVGQGPDGWYVSILVDCDSAGFVDLLLEDDGPYDTEGLACQAGTDRGRDWCTENSVAITRVCGRWR